MHSQETTDCVLNHGTISGLLETKKMDSFEKKVLDWKVACPPKYVYWSPSPQAEHI
jgi:hypothetical protein